MQLDYSLTNQYSNNTSYSLEYAQPDKALERTALEQSCAYIPEQNVIDLLNNDFKANKEKFLNTILRISGIFKYQSNSFNMNNHEFTYYDATDEHLAFAIQNYKFKATIDKGFLKAGASKKVSRAVMLNTMERVVHHRIDDADCIESTKKEIELTETLAKENSYLVCPFQWISISPNQIDMLQVEYSCDAEELQHASPMIQLLAFRQMAKGVAFLHNQGIIHSDLKPGNFFILGNILGEFYVKLGDLGAAYDKSKYQDLGAPGFSAPEQFKGRPSYKEKIDSFGFGASMYQILKANVEYYPGNKRNAMRGFGCLLQDEMDGIISDLKEGIKNDPKLSHLEKELKLKLADVCASLLLVHPASRSSCHDAVQVLDEISH